MNTQYSSLEDAFPDKPWPKKGHTMTSSKHTPEEKRDPEKEGRVFPTPIHRKAHAIKTHKKTIDDLTGTLPIDNDEPNYNPERIEHFSATKTNIIPPYYPSNDGTDFAYAPTSFKNDAHDIKLNRILNMIEQTQGSETPATQDMLLYIFTGIFFLFTFDTFVHLGKRVR
jgi:hypothetical protein